jgi:hypothetical protein
VAYEFEEKVGEEVVDEEALGGAFDCLKNAAELFKHEPIQKVSCGNESLTVLEVTLGQV